MPGYILHMTAAMMFLKRLPKTNRLVMNTAEQNKFLIGNLLPDAVKDKTYSHFRNPKSYGDIVEYPETEAFVKKYKNLLKDSSCLGYLFHLYIDRRFFKDYFPQILEFQDENDQKEKRRDKVTTVYLKRTGQKLPIWDFFSEKYYYGDYTKMNTYLVHRYHIPMILNPDIENPGIKEVHYEDVRDVLAKLQGYLSVSESVAEDVKIFEKEHLLAFLENVVKEFQVSENIDCIATENIIK